MHSDLALQARSESVSLGAIGVGDTNGRPDATERLVDMSPLHSQLRNRRILGRWSATLTLPGLWKGCPL